MGVATGSGDSCARPDPDGFKREVDGARGDSGLEKKKLVGVLSRCSSGLAQDTARATTDVINSATRVVLNGDSILSSLARIVGCVTYQ